MLRAIETSFVCLILARTAVYLAGATVPVAQ
jgi:hypothetical protein